MIIIYSNLVLNIIAEVVSELAKHSIIILPLILYTLNIRKS